MTFFERLEMLCQSKGTTPQNKDFMAAIGVASGTISNWKKKGAEPSNSITYIKIAEYLGVSLDCLFGMEPQPVEMTNDEAALLQKYRNLDLDGKAEVIHVANVQLQRMEKIGGGEQAKGSQGEAKTGTLD